MMYINKGSQDDFMRWLETFEDDDMIGYPQDARDCPLQHYLTSINPTLEISVSGVIGFIKGSDVRLEQREEWQWYVIHTADILRGPITKKQFLEAY
jgi:hypothetical protein